MGDVVVSFSHGFPVIFSIYPSLSDLISDSESVLFLTLASFNFDAGFE
jgi:hypothetical protein